MSQIRAHSRATADLLAACLRRVPGTVAATGAQRGRVQIVCDIELRAAFRKLEKKRDGASYGTRYGTSVARCDSITESCRRRRGLPIPCTRAAGRGESLLASEPPHRPLASIQRALCPIAPRASATAHVSKQRHEIAAAHHSILYCNDFRTSSIYRIPFRRCIPCVPCAHSGTLVHCGHDAHVCRLHSLRASRCRALIAYCTARKPSRKRCGSLSSCGRQTRPRPASSR
eukprot:IDg15988t1